MRVSLVVDLGNDSMQTASDVSHSIQMAMSKSGKLFEALVAGDHGSILDGNGNTVGTWAVEA